MAMTSGSLEPSDFAEGDQLGKYTIFARLGVGGMAEIYLAKQSGPRGFDRVCALKVMKELSVHDQSHDDMFLDEARIAAQLSHPNIVQIFDFGEEHGKLYLAMEYLAGESFARVLRVGETQKDLPTAYAIRALSLAAGGLHFAHSLADLTGKPLGIVHRDVSPDNVFVTYDGAVKLLDFGIAKAAHRQARTAVGVLKGKVSYVSPEQFANHEPDARSDVYALGVILFEALTGSHPFNRQTRETVEFLTGAAPLPRARDRNPSAPAELDEICAVAMERDPEARIHSALEFQRMLEAWLRTQDPVPDTAHLGSWMKGHFGERIEQRRQVMERLSTWTPPPPSPVLPAQVVSFPARPREAPEAAASAPGVAPPSVSTTPAVEVLPGLPPPREGSTAAPVPATGVEPGVAVRAAQGAGDGADAPVVAPARGAAPYAVVGVVGLLLVAGAAALLRPREVAAPPAVITPVAAPPPVAAPSPPAAAPPEAAPPTAPAPPPTPVAETVPLAPPPPGPADAPPEPADKAVAPSPAESPAPSHAHAAAKRKVERPPGALTLDTSPWTSVYLGTQLLGETPLVGISVPSGTHTFKLVNPVQKISREISVTIEPGKVTAKRLSLGP